MDFLTIIKYAVSILAILYAFFSTIFLFIQQKRKNKKIKEAGEQIAEEKNFFDELNAAIIDACKAAEIIYNRLAEPLGTKLSDMKKTEALREIKDFYESKGKTFDLQYISDKIEQLVKFSKEVNGKPLNSDETIAEQSTLPSIDEKSFLKAKEAAHASEIKYPNITI